MDLFPLEEHSTEEMAGGRSLLTVVEVSRLVVLGSAGGSAADVEGARDLSISIASVFSEEDARSIADACAKVDVSVLTTLESPNADGGRGSRERLTGARAIFAVDDDDDDDDDPIFDFSRSAEVALDDRGAEEVRDVDADRGRVLLARRGPPALVPAVVEVLAAAGCSSLTTIDRLDPVDFTKDGRRAILDARLGNVEVRDVDVGVADEEVSTVFW